MGKRTGGTVPGRGGATLLSSHPLPQGGHGQSEHGEAEPQPDENCRRQCAADEQRLVVLKVSGARSHRTRRFESHEGCPLAACEAKPSPSESFEIRPDFRPALQKAALGVTICRGRSEVREDLHALDGRAEVRAARALPHARDFAFGDEREAWKATLRARQVRFRPVAVNIAGGGRSGEFLPF